MPDTPIETLSKVTDTQLDCESAMYAQAHDALCRVEDAVAALGEILPRLQYNHEALLMGTSLEHKIGSDPDCLGCRAYNSGQTALAKFQGQP